MNKVYYYQIDIFKCPSHIYFSKLHNFIPHIIKKKLVYYSFYSELNDYD